MTAPLRHDPGSEVPRAVSQPVAGAARGKGSDERGSQAARSRRLALAGLSLCTLMPSLDTSIANAGLPGLAAALGGSFQQAQWIVLAYLLAITTSIVAVGRLGDLVGRRRLLLGGVGLFTAASLLCGVSRTLWFLVAARTLQGLGAATLLALTLAFVRELVDTGRAGRAMGLLGTMSALGTTLGPTVGGALLAGPGWRMLFLVNVPLGALAFGVLRQHLPERPVPSPAPAARFDWLGLVLLASALLAWALAMTLGHGRIRPLNAALLAAALCAAALFVVVETRSRAPLVDVALFRTPALRDGLALSALVATVIMATLVVGPFYLSYGLGLRVGAVGLVLSVGPLVAALTGVPAGRLVDAWETRRATLAGLAAMALGTLGLSLTQSRLGIAGYVAPLVCTTAGYALFQTANNTAVVASCRSEQTGVVSGLLSLSRNLGLISGASLMGAVFALGTGTADVAAATPDRVATGLRATFAFAALLIGSAIALAWRRSDPRRVRRALPGFPASAPRRAGLRDDSESADKSTERGLAGDR